MTVDHIQLPQSHIDAAFQQRIAQLARAEEIAGRGSAVWRDLHAQVWVSAHVYRPQTATHCPLGHSHDAEVVGLVRHHDRGCMKRRCRVCESTWLEPVDVAL